MANSIAFGAGGSPSSGRSVTGATYIHSDAMFTYPTGNFNLAGSRVVVNGGVSLNGSFGGGYTGAGANTSGDVYITSDGSYTTLTGYIGNGFDMVADGVITWSGGFQGTFYWTTVATAPATISLSKTGRNVTVTATASASNGGATITSYQVQYRTSTDNSTWGAWGNTQTLSSLSYTYSSLTPALYYQFRVYAVNSAGSSAATTSSSQFVAAGGKRWTGSAWTATTIAKRWNGSAWVDLTIAKRWNGSAWVDLS